MRNADAVRVAARIIRDYVGISMAHGYPPCQIGTLESWVVEALCDDKERASLQALVQPARDLIENISERGFHDNWKPLAAALRAYDKISAQSSTSRAGE